MFSRKTAICLLILIASICSVVQARELKAHSPSPDTPVIPWTKFSIQYATRVIGGSGSSSVVFYITRDGGLTWSKYGEDKDKKSPMLIAVPGEGVYGFITLISTARRQATPPRAGTRPDRFVIVDRTPPMARWLSPIGNDVKLTGEGIRLEWEAKDAHMGMKPVTLEYSTDGGSFWLPLREGLPAKGSINWQPPVMPGESQILLRMLAVDLAGNKRIVRNRANFQIDREPPVVTITGPDVSGAYKFDVDYNVNDAQSGISQVELFFTLDAGRTWRYAGTDKDLTSPIEFLAPSAKKVGLYIVATDSAGNRNTPPVQGDAPMSIVSLDFDDPQVSILPPFTSAETVVAMNNPVDIRWQATDANIKENSATIDLSYDGGQTWIKLADRQEANGVWAWTPSSQADNAMLRVTVSDTMGHSGSGFSPMFRVDSKRPNVSVSEVTPTGRTPSDNVGSIDEAMPPIPTPESSTSGNNLWTPDVADPAELTIETDEAIEVEPVKKPTEAPKAPKPEAVEDPFATDDGIGGIPDLATPGSLDIPDDLSLEMPGEEKKEEAAPAEKKPEAPVEIPQEPKTEGIEMPDMPSIPDMQPTEEPKKPAESATTPDMSEPIGDIPPLTPDKSGDSLDIPPAVGVEDDMKIDDIPSIMDGNELDIPKIPGEKEETVIEEKVTEEAIPPAISSPEQSTSNTPQSPEKLLELAENAYNEGRLDEAEDYGKKVIRLDSNNAKAFALVASALTDQDKFDDALDYAHKSVLLAPNDPSYQRVLGITYYSRANAIAKTLKKSPNLSSSQIKQLSAQMANSLSQSENVYKKMLLSNEQEFVKEANYRLGQVDYFRGTKLFKTLRQQNDSLREATVKYRRAYDIGKPEYREALQIGICNYRLNDYDQAELWLEQAQEISKNDRAPREAFFYLAMINDKLERPEQALRYWRKVATLYEKGSNYQVTAENRANALERELRP